MRLFALLIAFTIPAQAAVRKEELSLRGDLSKTSALETLEGQNRFFRACYNREFGESHKHPRGAIRVRFGVGPHGKVTVATVLASTFRNDRLENCVRDSVLSARFLEAEAEGDYVIRFPVPKHQQ